MVRRQWISHLFFIAFAMAMVHNILPHTHTKSKTKDTEHVGSSHYHHDDHHTHSHSKKSKPALPVFTHFSNSDFIASVKFSLKDKHCLQVLVFHHPIVITVSLPILTYLPSPVPHARDLPQKFFLSIQSLRAPPVYLS